VRFLVAGAGSWGTAFAHVLLERGHDVVLGCHHSEQAAAINETGRNPRYLQQVDLRVREGPRRLAADGDDAELLATTNDYDVILLDILLPRKNGLAVCRELRARNVTTPILMLTAKDSVEDKVVGLNTGADDYLTKPFAFDELLARVNALARRQSLDRSPLLRVDDLTLNPITHEVRRGDATIELTNKEYALLACLMRRPGQVLTRTQIAEQIWDMTFDNESNVIDVYIRYLRKKIDAGHQRSLIHTVRGVGYTMKA